MGTSRLNGYPQPHRVPRRSADEILAGLHEELHGRDQRLQGYDPAQRAEILEAMSMPEGDPVALDDIMPDPLDRDGEYLS